MDHLGSLYHGHKVCQIKILRYIGILEFDMCRIGARVELYPLEVCY